MSTDSVTDPSPQLKQPMMASESPNPVEAPPHVLALLDRLHQESKAQEASVDPIRMRNEANFDELMRDKFIALDQDKAHFLYQLVRAMGARNIVEVGTSFGVSTIYLALAVGSNLRRLGGEARIIGTEWEKSKAEQARKFWKEAGQDLVAQHIELREGDLLETLKENVPTVDVILLDIWAPMALPALRLLEPRMRPGTVILVDNTVAAAAGYKDLHAHLRSGDSLYSNLTLPYSGGMDMCIWQG